MAPPRGLIRGVPGLAADGGVCLQRAVEYCRLAVTEPAMATEVFTTKKFRKPTLAIIDQANAIISEYQALGFKLTLRQTFYQFVARHLLENKHGEYKRLGTIIKDARRVGLVDWDAIEDRTRQVHFHSFWHDPSGIIADAADAYRENAWQGQLYRPEVWIEKDALLGVIESVCREWRVPYFACRGNNSETLQYQAGKRFARGAPATAELREGNGQPLSVVRAPVPNHRVLGT